MIDQNPEIDELIDDLESQGHELAAQRATIKRLAEALKQILGSPAPMPGSDGYAQALLRHHRAELQARAALREAGGES